MSKRSAGQIALDQIDAEIATLEQVRDRLRSAMNETPKPKRERKPKAAKARPLSGQDQQAG